MVYLKISHVFFLSIGTYICCLPSFSLSFHAYALACVGMGVTLGPDSKGRQEPSMHHKSLLSLVSSISSKQGRYGCQVPQLRLCATGSRVE